MTDSNEGYEMPSDLQHTSKPLWGLSVLQFVFAVAGIALVISWYKLIILIGLDHESIIFIIGMIIIIAIDICLIFFELDLWIWHGFQYISRPYRMTRKDAACKSFSGIYGIEGNYYYTQYGDLCSILKLIPMNSNRIDPEKLGAVETADKNFLNALPCPVQIVGYTYNYTLEPYYESMLKYAQKLPAKMKSMLMFHLDFYTSYCENLEINQKELFMIMSVPSGASRPLETLNLNTDIIQTNLILCGVFGVRQTESEIANLAINVTTGIGNEGIDYLNLYMDVK